jgi:hypothetical protein
LQAVSDDGYVLKNICIARLLPVSRANLQAHSASLNPILWQLLDLLIASPENDVRRNAVLNIAVEPITVLRVIMTVTY